ncbi:MAG TPA: hypothetical protein VGI78_05880 [Acetobacteraceae bacterium]
MPTDTEFTLSLFDNTALSSWTDHTAQAVRDPSEIDQSDIGDAEEDNNTPESSADQAPRGSNFHLSGDRVLARGWPARARDNIAAINLSKMLEESGRAPTADEQAQLLCFVGFGASELAQNCFRRPGEDAFRPDWQDIGAALEAAVTPAEYAALQRATQYAHYTGDHGRPGASPTDPRRVVCHGDRGKDDHTAQGRRLLAAVEDPYRCA